MKPERNDIKVDGPVFAAKYAGVSTMQGEVCLSLVVDMQKYAEMIGLSDQQLRAFKDEVPRHFSVNLPISSVIQTLERADEEGAIEELMDELEQQGDHA